MIPIDKAVIARLSSHGSHFEILVDPENALKYKHGENIAIDDFVASKDVFADSGKGERANDEDLNKVFETTEFTKILDHILKHGEIQLTTKQKHEMQAERTKQVVALIAREAIDPRTKAPHPPTRIEQAMEEAHIHVDPFKNAESQMDKIVDKLVSILPIKFAKARIAVRIPGEYTGKVYGYLHNMKRIKEEWANDGSLLVLVELPAGLQGDFYEKLNHMTHGNVETKLVSTE